jgi:hypothetical protein
MLILLTVETEMYGVGAASSDIMFVRLPSSRFFKYEEQDENRNGISPGVWFS